MSLQTEILNLPLADQLDGQELIPVLQGSYLVLARLQKTTEAAAKCYACTFSQTGTNDPEAAVLSNTLGQPTWTRVNANNYELYLYGAFPEDKTIFNKGVDIDGNYLSRVDDNRMNFYCAGGDGTITNYPLKIEVYWYLIIDYPENFTAFTSVSGLDHIQLDWDSVPVADEYILEKCMDQVSWQEIYSGLLLTYDDYDIVLGSEYFYRIKAKKAGELDSDYNYLTHTA